MKRITLVVLVVLATLCLASCASDAPPQSGEDALAEFRESKAIVKFDEEYIADIGIVLEAAKNGDVEQAIKTNAVVSSMCDDVINMKNIPPKCETLHGYYSDSAQAIKDASDYFCDAAIAKSVGDIVGSTSDLKKATSKLDFANTCATYCASESVNLMEDTETG